MWTFVIVSFGLFMVTLDNLVVSTALPSLRVDLGAGLEGLQWVVNGYTLAFAVLLLPAAALELAIVGAERPSLADVGLLLYLGTGLAALAYVLLGYALRRLEAGVVGVFSNVAPLVGVAAAVIVLHEPVTSLQLAGGALIGSGIWLAARA